MRINIYEEELTDEVNGVIKVSQNGEEFHAVRFFLESPASILEHSTIEDDDRNAITFWVRHDKLPWLRDILMNGVRAVENLHDAGRPAVPDRDPEPEPENLPQSAHPSPPPAFVDPNAVMACPVCSGTVRADTLVFHLGTSHNIV